MSDAAPSGKDAASRRSSAARVAQYVTSSIAMGLLASFSGAGSLGEGTRAITFVKGAYMCASVSDEVAVKGNRASALDRFLTRLLLRSRLSEEECEAVLALGGREAITAGHRDIVKPGQTIDFACLVIDGLAGRFDQLANGHRQITAIHIAGDMCDLHSVAVPHTGWGIEALTGTTILKVPHSQLRELTVRYPAIAYAFWRDTIADASILSKWISALGRRSAKLRMAHLICELGIRIEQAKLGTRNSYALPATQAQLADVIGVTTVHVNRTFQTLRREGLLNNEGMHIRVLDFERLCSLAEFDPGYLLLDTGAK